MTNRDHSLDEIIEMAWCDKTSFDDIQEIIGLPEADIIQIMRQNLKPNSFKLWRKRVTGRKAKHRKLNKPVLPDSPDASDPLDTQER